MNKQVVGVHDASKQIHKTCKKKSTVKVVYISNPVKINTSASQFRALVQQLTGKDAGEVFLELSNLENQEQEQEQEQAESEEVQKEDTHDAVACVENGENLINGSSDLLLSLQDITGYFSPSNLWYESAFHVDASKV